MWQAISVAVAILSVFLAALRGEQFNRVEGLVVAAGVISLSVAIVGGLIFIGAVEDEPAPGCVNTDGELNATISKGQTTIHPRATQSRRLPVRFSRVARSSLTSTASVRSSPTRSTLKFPTAGGFASAKMNWSPRPIRPETFHLPDLELGVGRRPGRPQAGNPLQDLQVSPAYPLPLSSSSWHPPSTSRRTDTPSRPIRLRFSTHQPTIAADPVHTHREGAGSAA